jgi:hypothetical protein
MAFIYFGSRRSYLIKVYKRKKKSLFYGQRKFYGYIILVVTREAYGRYYWIKRARPSHSHWLWPGKKKTWPGSNLVTTCASWDFIRESPKLYGGHFITFNVHCLIHLPADVSRYGPLDDFSCFPFENFLYQLKKLIRHSANPLVQLVKRLIEMSNCWGTYSFESHCHTFAHVPEISGPHSDGHTWNNTH